MSLGYTSHGEITRWALTAMRGALITRQKRGCTDDAEGRPDGAVGRRWGDVATNLQEAAFLEA